VNELEERVAKVDRLLHAHAGGIELTDVDSSGRVRLRYTGMCTGCPFKPLTTEATVRPLLLELDGVSTVEIAGGRISDEAQARLRAALGPMQCPATPLELAAIS
jgi:Fe-S cluster biogenesis protein NfuA